VRAASWALLALSCASQSASERPDERVDGDRPAQPAAPQKQGDLQAAAASAAAEAMAAVARMQEARARAERECAPLESLNIAVPEELAVGELAARAATSGKAFYVEPLPQKTWAAARAAKPGPLPAGEKNDVTSYVQRVGAAVALGSARPWLPWTFGVLEDDAPRAQSSLGGYVFVTTGLLKKLENEAQLAALLAHEVAQAAGRDHLDRYRVARGQMCRVALTGLYLIESGASSVPGGEAFVANAKFGKTMRKLSAPDGFDLDRDPGVDGDFLAWYAGQSFQLAALRGFGADEEARADAEAAVMLGSAGYDAAALEQALALVDGGKNAARIDALGRLRAQGGFGLSGGKTPPFPREVHLPR
jgi:Zn-dependent protease with chaperone function